jgi:hypothetical protein
LKVFNKVSKNGGKWWNVGFFVLFLQNVRKTQE